jgi:hypothetical protein
MPTTCLPDLEAHVLVRIGSQVRDFALVVTDDGVRLRGRAHSYYTKQLAQHAVMAMTAISILANEIEVAHVNGP